jgi:hypothetical protein
MPRIKFDTRAATERGNRQVRNSWRLWRRCPNRRCHRARACTEDVMRDPRCNRQLSREEQAWVNGVSFMVGIGGTTEQVIKVGTLAVEGYLQMQELIDMLRDLMALMREQGIGAER